MSTLSHCSQLCLANRMEFKDNVSARVCTFPVYRFTHIQGNDSFLDGDAFFMFKFDKQQVCVCVCVCVCRVAQLFV